MIDHRAVIPSSREVALGAAPSELHVRNSDNALYIDLGVDDAVTQLPTVVGIDIAAGAMGRQA